ncbi:AIM24 family protein [Desulfonema magnum]|uniref:Tryptophan RNA-binding domain-containing protein n=1 Tax=Desulfonema magnum TaxID=45655 RepID=A0A975BX22_9BACT|nr:AIM24 family protein [Desulfonema magnum]QTA92947.1 tryptophan RNA-binding domain-containing protein [Desulfonema magnum]
MFDFTVHQEVTCVAKGEGQFFSKLGSMVAYQGEFKAEKILLGPNQGVLDSVIGFAKRKLTGENMPLMKVSGRGIYYMADRAQHVSVITLQPGQSIGVESENLLSFTEDCKYSVRFIGVGVVSQKGLFTSELTARGEKPQVAVTTDGNPIILETPCAVDPDAVVCWTGRDPNFKTDISWKTFLGQSSGESYYLEFTDPGEIVIVQPSERESGVSLSID